MPKKSHSFRTLSDIECAVKGCHKKLKKRIVEEHPEFDRCFRHFKNLERIQKGLKPE